MSDNPPENPNSNTSYESPSPTLAKSKDAEDHSPEATDKAGNANRQPQPLREIMRTVWAFIREPQNANAVMAVFTGLLFLSSVAYSIVATLQWRGVREQLALMRTDQRAWMGIPTLEVVGKVETGTPLVIRLVFHNSGKTPAAYVTAVTIADPKPFNAPPDIALREGEVMRKIGFASPNSGFDSLVSPTQGKPLTETAFNEIASGRCRIYVHGRIEYSDIFRKEHWMTFCYYLAPDGGTFLVCNEPRYNEMDENY